VSYCIISLFLSTAWYRTLRVLSQDEIRPLEAHLIYARSQIAKYIPGNVFHLASRHAMSKRSGASHGPLVGAALFEAAVLVAAASAVALAGVLAGPGFFEARSRLEYVALLTVAVLFPFLVNLVAVKFGILKRTRTKQLSVMALIRGVFPSFILYMLFFSAAGAILVVISVFVDGPREFISLFPLSAAFAVSWIAGYVTPGASAGIGVREAVMVGWLGSVMGDPEAIVVTVVFRIVTTVGDFLFFLLALVVMSATHRSVGLDEPRK
jgi:uncharacterized membrane protein YbhN (UPF0104 family)